MKYPTFDDWLNEEVTMPGGQKMARRQLFPPNHSSTAAAFLGFQAARDNGQPVSAQETQGNQDV
ncbi:MAG TPA: hypothetical protein VFM18_07405 [Methanosarcina sp.]|nr:hypothetical protein [Methanosarcina sp.]